MSGQKKIDFNKDWWAGNLDMEKRFDRLYYWFTIADPFKAFVSNSTVREWNKELRDMEKEAKATSGGVATVDSSRYTELCYRKKVLISCIHPDSGDLLPWFARTNAFALANIPIIGAMMLSPPTMFNTFFW